jgi:hypothetical protein
MNEGQGKSSLFQSLVPRVVFKDWTVSFDGLTIKF